MTDESPREGRPSESLRREVEAPRTGASLWLPMMALASAAMLTIVSGVAVMTRPARPVLMVPAAEAAPAETPRALTADEKREIERLLLQVDHASAESERWRRENIIEVRVPCHAAVYRGDLDGRPQPFEECIEYRRKRSSDVPSTKTP